MIFESGAQDPIALPEYGRMLADAIPGAQFELIPGSSHGLTIQKADEINQMLMRFLESVEISSAIKLNEVNLS